MYKYSIGSLCTAFDQFREWLLSLPHIGWLNLAAYRDWTVLQRCASDAVLISELLTVVLCQFFSF